MSCEQERHTSTRSGIHLYRKKMTQYSGFPNRLLTLVRIFTVRLMMGRWRRLCMKFVWSDMIERGIRGNPITYLQGYTITVKAFKESHEKDVERLSPDRRRETESKEVSACDRYYFRWGSGNPDSTWNEPNRLSWRWPVIVEFGMHFSQCLDVDLSSDIRTRPILRIIISQLELITKNSQIDWQQWIIGKTDWDLKQMGALYCLTHLLLRE